MATSFIEEWVELIRPLFSESVKIEIDEGDDVVVRIDWKLTSDLSRPNKRSRLIRIIISKEAITDCKDNRTAGLKFKQVVQSRLVSFNPEHDSNKYSKTPMEDWIISTFDIN